MEWSGVDAGSDDGKKGSNKSRLHIQKPMYRGTIKVRTVSGLSYMQHARRLHLIVSISARIEEKGVFMKPVHQERIERKYLLPTTSPYIRKW